MKKVLLVFLVLFLLIGLGAYYYYQQEGPPQEPKLLKISNVKLNDVSLPPNMAVYFNADAHLHNPNGFSMNIASTDFDVFVNGTKATRVSQEVNTKMPANSEFILPIRFEIPLKENESFKGLGGLLKGALKKQALDIRSEGTITIKVFKYTFDIPFEHENSYNLMDYLK